LLAGQKEAFQAAINRASIKTALDALVRTTVDHLRDEGRASFFLMKPDGTAINHLTGLGDEYTRVVGDLPIAADSFGCGLAVYTGEPVISPDVDLDPNWTPHLWLARQFDYRGCWSFPVKTAGGKNVGTYCMYSRKPRHPTQHNMEFAAAVTRTAAIIISRSQEEERAQAEESLKEADRRKDEFLAMLAHELRNPLAAIRNAGEILLRTDGDERGVQSAAEILNRRACATGWVSVSPWSKTWWKCTAEPLRPRALAWATSVSSSCVRRLWLKRPSHRPTPPSANRR
jgi:GAF domain-containing protein